jgi:hypothetical protein
LADVGEHPDPAGGNALHERQRCQRERGRVEQESPGLHGKAQQPPAARQQQVQRVQRPAHGEHRQRRRGIVLAQVGEVGERGGGGCQAEGDDGLRVHRRAYWLTARRAGGLAFKEGAALR